jgi:hypothetical protein
MLTYSFLVLSVVLAVPGVLVWAVRADLRPVIHRMMLASIPFALTERLFYPEYWQPRFLFDLVNVFGFGIEDLLFVMGLAAFSSTAWAVVSRQSLVAGGGRASLRNALVVLIACFIAVGLVAIAGIPMIYGAPVIMTVFGGGICIVRRDLWWPSLGGGVVTTLVYSGACLLLMLLIPRVFELDWNSDKFLNVFVLGIPLEELLYASTSGFIATAFYPFVTGARFVAHERPDN